MLRAVIVSDSMEPVLQVNNSYPISQATYGSLRRFDIIVFKIGEDLCAHFVWGKANCQKTDQELLITKSLKNVNQNDFPVHMNRVVGIIDEKEINNFLKFKIYFSIFVSRLLKGNQ